MRLKLFDGPYYNMTKILLSMIGQWPLQPFWQKLMIQMTVFSYLLSILIPEVIKLIDVRDDLDVVVECLAPIGLHILNALKCFTTSYHANKLVKLMAHMDRDWKSRVDADGTKVLHHWAERGRILAKGYALYLFIGGTLYVCAPLVPFFLDVVKPLNESRPREFLFRTEYYVDQDQYFVPIFLHALTTTSVSMVIVAACDTMYSAFIHYACAVFVELSQELEYPVKNKDDSFYVSKNDDYFYNHIVKCVKKHKEVIEFCDFLESTYTVYSFGTVGLNIFLISFTGVQTVTKVDNPSLFVRYSIYVFGQIMHAFFGCWHGQLLIDYSEAIIISAYKSRWHGSSLRSCRLLTLIMMRSTKPCQLTAGKLFSVSLQTFTTIIKTAMSYFTLLRSLQ
uniref:Odorant receptor n=1 Tax=Campoletis chlorideae TaxID=219166 RepID=A0A346D419_9HYME|nr:odorant receptor [Campoletis chlorideae]